ncbi:MAG: ATP-binding cassette domain-containing protein [Pseudonocardiales bacterium]|nr:ATP-binding cassette domain-containing protein [Pseudonocardiales bacterium]
MTGRLSPVDAARTDWLAARAALARVLPADQVKELPGSPPAGPDAIRDAALACGTRAVPVEPSVLTAPARSPGLVLDHDGCWVAITAGATRAHRNARTDRAAWRLYRRLGPGCSGVAGLLAVARPSRWATAVVLASGALAAMVASAVPLVVARAATGHSVLAFEALAAAGLVLALLLGVRDRAATVIQSQLQAVLEPALWDRVLDPEWSGLRDRAPEQLASAANLLSQLRTLTAAAALDGLLALTTVVSTTVLLATAGFWLALAAGLVGAVVVATLWAASRPGGARDRRPDPADSGALLRAVLTGIDEIHLGARERAMLDLLSAPAPRKDGERAEERLAAAAAALRPLLLAGLLTAAWFTDLGPAGLLAGCSAAVLLSVVFGRADAVARSVLVVGAGAVNLTRDVLRAPGHPNRAQVLPGELTGAVEVASVSLHHDGRPAVDQVSLRIAPGEFLAIAGGSGSGKSSLLRLIAGLDVPTRGEVRLDGTPVPELLLDAVRGQVSLLAQDADVPRGTVRSVVAGSAGRDADDHVWEVLGEVGLAEEIRRLPMGLSTVVSGGAAGFAASQLRLMLLARALLRRPRLLLLDEALGTIDDQARSRLIEYLQRLAITRIAVTRCPQLARAADRVVVLERGTVVETGTFDALAAAGGVLARLFDPCLRDENL